MPVLARMPQKAIARVALAGAILILAGCSMLPGHAPKVQLVNVAPQSVGLLSQTLLLTLQVSNPNDSALRAKAGEARLWVRGREIAYGLLAQPILVPAYGSTQVQIPVTGNFLPLLGDLGRGSLPYEVKGYLVTDPLALRIPFQARGVLHLPGPPGESASAP
ncbi:LEA type 2 family protein [Acidithiobacillus sulfuriphilus]|uniref:LEA type 2 family protein n=1 Tax=Acidithiobacillus sulfuriphilus TaxID=1867749 RepID=UPI003F63A0CA